MADRHGSLESVYTYRRLLDEVDENIGVDAAVAGRGD
jgi:hypothetical protein